MIPYQVINKNKIQQYEEEIERLNKTILQAAEFISEIGGLFSFKLFIN